MVVRRSGIRYAQRGVTLVELLLAVAIGAILMATLNGLVKLGLDAQTTGRAGNELTYQGRFALERIAAAARASVPKVLAVPAANTTGDWFAPAGCSGAACVMYCRKTSTSELIETTTADTGCTGTTVIASKVSAFSATLPAAMGQFDRQTAVIGLTITDGSKTVSLSASTRLGGGTQ